MQVEITTHRAEVYRPDSRKPEVTFSDVVETDLSRRDFTVNAMALAPARAASWSTPSTAPPTWPPGGCARRSTPRCPSPTTRCGCCGRPGSSPATGSSPTPALVAAVTELAGRLEIVSRRADPRRARQAARGRRPVGRACGSWSTPAWPTSSCPSCRPCASSRTRSTTTRTCWPTRSPWWPRPAPSSVRAPGRPAPRRRQAQDPLVRRRAASASTTTRWSAPAWPRSGMRALRYPNDDIEAGRASWCTSTCASTPTAWAGPTAPCAATCATPAPLLDELNELTRCDCTTRNQRKARALGRRMDELEARIAELAERGGAGRHPPRPRRPPGDGAASACRPAGSSARPWTSCSSPPRRGPARRGRGRAPRPGLGPGAGIVVVRTRAHGLFHSFGAPPWAGKYW